MSEARTLSHYEQQLLDILQEECAEVIQAVSKIRRFGLHSYNPYIPGSKDNLSNPHDELGDIQGMVDLLTLGETPLIDSFLIGESAFIKRHFFHRGAHPHYDINGDQQAYIIGLGAKVVSSKEIARLSKLMLQKSSILPSQDVV